MFKTVSRKECKVQLNDASISMSVSVVKALLFLLTFLISTHAKALSLSPIQIVTEHLPPFQIDNNGKVSGYVTEIVQTALDTAKIDYSITAYPWTRAYNMAQKVANTCVYSIARTPEREKLFQWTQVVATTNSTFIGLAKSDIHLRSVDDAKNYRIAVLRDDATHQTLLKKGFEEGKNLFIVNNTHSLLKLLVQRKSIDLILADRVTVKYRAQYDNIDPQIFKPFLHLNNKPFDFYFACSQSTPKATIERINQAMIHIKETGQQEEIKQRWQSD